MLNSSDSHRRRKKDPDRERRSPRSKDKDRERRRRSRSRKTRSTASKDDDPDKPPSLPKRPSSERVRSSTSTSTLASSQASKSHKMAVVPEMSRRGSLGSDNTSRISLPYPSHSKTYAKESIYAREPVDRRKSTMTPDATDAEASSAEKDDEQPQPPNRVPPPPSRAPPSPPLTATTAADLRRAASANSMGRKDADIIARETEDGRRSVDSGTRMTSHAGPRIASRSSVREGDEFDGTDLTSTTGSQPSTIRAKSPQLAPRTKTASPSNARPPGRTSTPVRTSTPTRTSTPARTSTPIKCKVKSRAPSEYTLDSEATSVIQDHSSHHRGPSPPQSDASPSSVVDSSPRTPTQHSVLPSVVSSAKDGPSVIEVMTDPMSRTQSVDPSYAQPPMTTPPPPPPPPAMMEAPRVDYLLQNGGLAKPIPRSLLAAIDGVPASAYSHYTTPRLSGAQAHDVRSFFKPLQNVLNSYNTVMDTSGSLAVATGYRSVARRLLDRLENVFARNISSEHCECMMCFDRPIVEDSAGVNWGEVLELVSGRCELPPWPPYEEGPGPGLGISSSDLEAPCQRIDVDVPEQYREHYEKQSKKTKVAVQSWLSDQQDNVPEDADDETLTFIMLTRLEQPQRPLFYALLWGLEKLPNPRTQKPDTGPPAYLTKAGLALQRLYRLHSPPRDQLTVMYLIRHADMHSMLATLAAVTKHEWEILVSGRFDGFLWSGAEDLPELNGTPPRTGSRAGQMRPADGPQRFASPFSPYSRPGSTRPGSVRPPGGAPVQIDEETEIAVLAEIEREIYLGMEAMEDAFEQLHNQAEMVRRRLRERAAALSMVAQQRRGAGMGGIEVRTDTPANMRDADEGIDDLKSEIGPDDSASNVSNNRRRKAHRARERRTPAPVEEESEEDVALAERIRRRF